MSIKLSLLCEVESATSNLMTDGLYHRIALLEFVSYVFATCNIGLLSLSSLSDTKNKKVAMIAMCVWLHTAIQ